MNTTIDVEKNRERAVIFVGRLGDLNIGNPKGIPSEFANKSDEELHEIADEYSKELVEPTDLTCLACIDGRCTLHNADGSAPEIRYKRVGGSAANFGVALNADATFLDTISSDAPLDKQVEEVDEHVTRLTGFERSAHLGGCGGANGEIEDNEAINSNPNILAGVKTLMRIPAVREYFGVDYDDSLGEKVRVNAGKTATFLEEQGWVGQKYVDTVTQQNPRGVEDLEVDHEDKDYHGHKEKSLTIVIGDKTLSKDDEFVWNLKTTKEIAKALAGGRGEEGYVQALIAEIAKHMAVANRLPSDKTPVFVLAA